MNECKYIEMVLPNSFDKGYTSFWKSGAILRSYFLKNINFVHWAPALMKNEDNKLFFGLRILRAYQTRYEKRFVKSVTKEFKDNLGITIEEYKMDGEIYLVMPLDALYTMATLCKMKGY